MTPKPRKAGWSPVTLTISNEVAQALRLLGVYSGQEMGVLADKAIRQGKLFADLAYAQGKDVPALPLSAQDIQPHSYTAAAGSPALPDAIVFHRPAPKPARQPGEHQEPGSPELLAKLEALLKAEKITQPDIAKALGITTANFRSWRKLSTPWVPAKYIPGAVAFLKERGIEPATKG